MNLFLSSLMFSVKNVSFPAKTAVSGNQKNFANGLDSCYLFNLEHRTEHEIDRAYGVHAFDNPELSDR